LTEYAKDEIIPLRLVTYYLKLY